MKKIMFVDERKIVNYSGGAERVICNFANEFANRNFEVSIVCMDREYGSPLYELNSKVDFINLAYDNEKLIFFKGVKWQVKKIQKEILRTVAGKDFVLMGKKIEDPKKEYFFNNMIILLKKVIDKVKPDVIFSISIDGAYIAQQAMSSKIPVVAMCHTDPTDYIPKLSYRQLQAWRKAKKIQVLLDDYKQKLEKISLSNVIQIPNAVPQFLEDKIRDHSECYNTIVSVGRIEGAIKRQDVLIKAFAKLSNCFPEWKINFWGAIENKRYMRKLDLLVRTLGLEDKVFFKGVSNDILGVYRSSDVFVSTSALEGFPMALTEAMSYGLPVIGFDRCTAVKEVIGENGMLFADERELVIALKSLMSDKEKRCKMGENAHVAMKKYSPQHIWDRWNDCIKEIVGNDKEI